MDDYEKLMKEIEKQAMEMQKKMQEQMGNMSPEELTAMMNDLAAQGLEDNDQYMTDEELEQFIAENTPSPEHAKYLPIGALLIGTWAEPYVTLAITCDKDDVFGALEGGWGISDRKDGLKMMESLLAGRHANKFKADHLALKAGKNDKVDPDSVEDYEATVSAITEVLELPMSYIEKCETLYAWDLERIGYLARLFAHVGYITEAEAWDWMKKAGAKIKETFTCWEDYIVSILIGRGFAMGLAEEPFAVAYDLLTDSRSFLDEHPIKDL